MKPLMKLALWNADGLAQHKNELEFFLNNQGIQVMFISKTHFTNKNFLKIHGYKLYHTQHPSGRAHEGSAIIIKSTVKHYKFTSCETDYLQATNMAIEDWHSLVTLSAVYCSPKHNLSKNSFDPFLESFGGRFIAGDNFNAKHPQWGTRIIITRGRNLLKSMNSNKLNYLSSNERTYWPTDPNKLPDPLDFFVIKNISPELHKNQLFARTFLRLFVTVVINSSIIENWPNEQIHNQLTNWHTFNTSLLTLLPLRTENDIDAAVDCFSNNIINAIRSSSPNQESIRNQPYPDYIKRRNSEKRKLRTMWHSSRLPEDRHRLNKATAKLMKVLNNFKNYYFQKYLGNLSPLADTKHSLWKAARWFTRPAQRIPPIRTTQGGWARSSTDKTNVFVLHLTEVFNPHCLASNLEEAEILDYLQSLFQMSLPIVSFTAAEVIWYSFSTTKKHRGTTE